MTVEILNWEKSQLELDELRTQSWNSNFDTTNWADSWWKDELDCDEYATHFGIRDPSTGLLLASIRTTVHHEWKTCPIAKWVDEAERLTFPIGFHSKLCVRPEGRGRGLARHLEKYSSNHLKMVGCAQSFAYLRVSKEWLASYMSFGWEVFNETSTSFYDGSLKATWLLRRSLNAAS